MDKYLDFNTLVRNETEFHIECWDRDAEVSILAPHGGGIEPHTSEIAHLIAGNDCNCYCFNGTKNDNNHTLRIASHRYDEPTALALIKKSETVITIHGCREKRAFIHIGGLDRELGEKIETCLNEVAIPCRMCPPQSPFGGINPANICNLGRSGKGVQLEISRELRDAAPAWKIIAEAVRKALGLNTASI